MVDPLFPHDTHEQRDRDTGTPRWVKAFGLIAVVLVLVFVIVMLTGRAGGHGPQRHAPSGAWDFLTQA